MHTLLKTKIGPFLVIASVLAVWTLLAAQPVQAHTTTLPTPTCSSLPTAEGFFTATETAAIASGALTPSATPKVGTGIAANGGNENLRYAKITIPQIAAGELRVFDTRTSGVSDAILCRPGTDVASRTSYSAHNAANTAASRADAASTAAGETNASVSAARSALHAAAAALDSAARSLTAAGNTSAAATAIADATTARNFANDTATNTDAANFVTPLSDAADDLEIARDAFHARFQIRTEVNPGDEEYILVIATDTDPTWRLQFHGAIVTSTATAIQMQRQRTLNAGDQHTYPITVTTPGLLTVETTGRTDTAGMLSAAVTAEDDSSGSGDNFKIVAPVTTTAYTVTVEGQNENTTGGYTLDMDFKVAMQTGVTAPTGATVPAATAWTDTGIPADDTMLQIQPSTDEDYFLLTIDTDSSGFLTIEATDDTTSATDAATTGTFYGPTGELATDTNSGADSSHFRIRAPVEEGVAYLVKVTGTTGVYQLSVVLDQAEGDALIAIPSTQSGPASVDCTTNDTGEICMPDTGDPLETERYAFNIMEPGVLYLHTTGSIDTVGTLYGPGGNRINNPDADDNAGDGNNFRIAANVNPGLHLLEVRGKTRDTQGVYSLVANFVAGDGPVTTPGTDEGLQAEIDRLQGLLDECRAGVETDARGNLDDPNSVGVNTGYRSGVGLIRGWVCAANEVEVSIYDATDRLVDTVSTPHGSVRTDTTGICGHSNTGFAAQYNYNHLAEGEYTARAYADGDMIGEARTFTVVHLTEFSRNDTDRFLTDLPAGTCDVEDFPETGDAVRLRWEESLQNFVIEDAG